MKGLQKMLEDLKPGDTVVVETMAHLGDNLAVVCSML